MNTKNKEYFTKLIQKLGEKDSGYKVGTVLTTKFNFSRKLTPSYGEVKKQKKSMSFLSPRSLRVSDVQEVAAEKVMIEKGEFNLYLCYIKVVGSIDLIALFLADPLYGTNVPELIISAQENEYVRGGITRVQSAVDQQYPTHADRFMRLVIEEAIKTMDKFYQPKSSNNKEMPKRNFFKDTFLAAIDVYRNLFRQA